MGYSKGGGGECHERTEVFGYEVTLRTIGCSNCWHELINYRIERMEASDWFTPTSCTESSVVLLFEILLNQTEIRLHLPFSD